MKRKLFIALAITLMVVLTGCSGSSNLEEGTFTAYVHGAKFDNASLTILSDGTGYYNPSSSQFNWNLSGKKFHATPVDSTGNDNLFFKRSNEDNLECKNGYIAIKDTALSGKIPKGDTFDTTVPYYDFDDLHFLDNGTLIVSNQNDPSDSETYTYERQGDFIVTDYCEFTGETAYFLVIDGTIYPDYYCPESKLPDIL